MRAALAGFERHSEPWSGSTDERSAGNGSIMRLAPVPLFFAHDREAAIARAADSSRTTHGAREAVDGCRYVAALIVSALQGRSKEDLTSTLFTPVPELWKREPSRGHTGEMARQAGAPRHARRFCDAIYARAALTLAKFFSGLQIC